MHAYFGCHELGDRVRESLGLGTDDADRDDGHDGESPQLTDKPRQHPRLPSELLEHLKAETFLDGPVEDLVKHLQAECTQLLAAIALG